MQEENNEVSRRSLLRSAAISGVGVAAGGSILAGLGSETAHAAVERVGAGEEWFSQRAYCLSGNKVLQARDGSLIPATTFAHQIYRPRSRQRLWRASAGVTKRQTRRCLPAARRSSWIWCI